MMPAVAASRMSSSMMNCLKRGSWGSVTSTAIMKSSALSPSRNTLSPSTPRW